MATQYTLIEYMPAHLRAHGRAVSPGCAVRAYVQGDVDPTDLHPRWASVIEDGIDTLPEDEPSVCASDLPREVWRHVAEPREDGDV